ncbi:hypothetical protein [Bradymonas sediminis]|uniref:Uncharacterized protein n=1 Tax=Bradymonas sediminis TaxID=1548548 RepID=A0A2Z4FR80_9DELT|nr:hypothetical protein [Bradymonas sediminis]AWV91204.1 hypothetical protein DN745_18480 [Bradymonas sediminis]TDP73769.1 hypothetical protein DFR33_105101 [Bradymonas sediminis]
MSKLSFPDLPAHDSQEADVRQWLPDAEAIVDACEALAAAGEPAGVESVFEEMGAPKLDMTVTALSARAALQAAEEGRAFYHHELRERVAMPEDQAPEIAVWEAGTVPVWNQGILEEPKYFSFFLDTPFPAFNPNHRRKWRPHELIHGSMKFFWHPQMTRFEMYVGSRINELLPVVHWYSFDEIYRPRCPEHRGEQLYQEYCGECEAAAKPYWETTPEWRATQRAQALTWAERGIAHFEREWNACMAEIQSGDLHPIEGYKLDSSSDAIGYMRSHWNRMTAWSFGAWAELFLTDDLDYYSSLGRYMTHLKDTTRRLLGGDIGVDLERYKTLRARRAIQDLAYRIYVAMGWLAENSAGLDAVEAHLTPALEQAAHHVHHMLTDAKIADYSNDVLRDLLQAFERVQGHFPDEIANSVAALGYQWWEPEQFAHAGLAQLHTGLRDALPSAADILGDHGLDQHAQKFALSEPFRAHGRLAERFADYLAAEAAAGTLDADEQFAAELAKFEAWATRAPREDRVAELFASIPNSFDELAIRPGTVRLNETLTRQRFPADIAAAITGDPQLAEQDEDVELGRIFLRGELRLMLVDVEEAKIFDAIESGQPRCDWVDAIDIDSMAALLENGFVIWLPEPF